MLQAKDDILSIFLLFYIEPFFLHVRQNVFYLSLHKSKVALNICGGKGLGFLNVGILF
jgi:hypothetical protein